LTWLDSSRSRALLPRKRHLRPPNLWLSVRLAEGQITAQQLGEGFLLG